MLMEEHMKYHEFDQDEASRDMLHFSPCSSFNVRANGIFWGSCECIPYMY